MYVPKGTIDNYKATAGWNDFIFIEEGTPTNINSAKIVQTTEFERFTIGGKRISKPQHGVNIIKRMMERLKRS